MEVAYKVITIVALVVAVFFTLLVLLTGKGDAMSGGASGVRTTFKGKASFEDKMYNLILYLGAGFMVLMIALDFLSERIYNV
jgi:preprotein translocase subunit SecG